MIVEIDGYFDRTLLLSEKDLSEGKLREIYDQLKSEGISWRELPDILCKRYNMKKDEKLESVIIDIVIDTDTEQIYRPHY